MDNQPAGEESFDTATYPGRYVADILRTCSVTSYQITYTKLDGIDEFIYCAERSLSAYSLGTGWRQYTTFSEGATEPPGWSQATVRTLWRYNLYGVTP